MSALRAATVLLFPQYTYAERLHTLAVRTRLVGRTSSSRCLASRVPDEAEAHHRAANVCCAPVESPQGSSSASVRCVPNGPPKLAIGNLVCAVRVKQLPLKKKPGVSHPPLLMKHSSPPS